MSYLGHIVLSRELTDFGIYPPINIQNSASSEMAKNDIMYQALVGALRKQGGIFSNAIESSKSL